MVGSTVGFGVEVSPLWGLRDNGGSKVGPHMVLIWFGEGDAFVPKPTISAGKSCIYYLINVIFTPVSPIHSVQPPLPLVDRVTW